MITNNVTRLLQSRKIKFVHYEMDGEKHSALQAARILGIPAAQIYKTIVVLRRAPRKPVLALISAEQQADLKLIADCLKEKKVSLASQDEAEKLTGLLSGGISPLALINKGFQTLLDESALSYEEINISGGQRNLNIRLPVKDLIKLTKARTARIGITLD